MGEGMCEFKSSPKEIEYFNEYNVNLFFSKLFVFTFFFNFYFAWFNIYFIYFSMFIMHLTFSFIFVDLTIKLSIFKKLCNSNKQLYYVTTS